MKARDIVKEFCYDHNIDMVDIHGKLGIVTQIPKMTIIDICCELHHNGFENFVDELGYPAIVETEDCSVLCFENITYSDDYETSEYSTAHLMIELGFPSDIVSDYAVGEISVTDVRSGDIRYLSDFTLTKKYIEEFESETGNTVYHVIRQYIDGVPHTALLFVNTSEDGWMQNTVKKYYQTGSLSAYVVDASTQNGVVKEIAVFTNKDGVLEWSY